MFSGTIFIAFIICAIYFCSAMFTVDHILAKKTYLRTCASLFADECAVCKSGNG